MPYESRRFSKVIGIAAKFHRANCSLRLLTVGDALTVVEI
jgi:hypothetical protein